MAVFRFRKIPMRRFLLSSVLSLAAIPAGAQDLKRDVAYLASDAMQGREAGTKEYQAAADYVAREMQTAGLVPAGENGGWFQRVPLVSAQLVQGSTLSVTRGRRRVPLVFNRDWTQRAEVRAASVDVSAPVVFAGYGIVDPVSGRNDLAGLDVRGKIVAVLSGAPDTLASDERAHLSSREEKAKAAQAAGAVGIVTLETPAANAAYPFASSAKRWDSVSMNWAHPDGTPDLAAPLVPSLGYFSMDGAAKLFAGAKISWPAVLAAAKAGQPVPTGPLTVTLSARLRARMNHIASPNVVGLLPGSDPALKAEHVVLSAHLDHVGVGRPDATGDTIYNGALDNAMGVAAMLDAARTIARGPRPRRSILFVAVTAEEKGLIGSDYFAHKPTVDKASVVANVNLDMPILTYRFVDMVALGADRSGVGPIVAAAARAEGIALVPDPMPEEGNFTRTDHYSFVQQGVPAVSLDLGPGGPGRAATEDFLEHHYHQPSDALSLPIDWTAADKFVAVNVGVTRGLANADRRPVWNKGDFFGTTFGGPMAQ